MTYRLDNGGLQLETANFGDGVIHPTINGGQEIHYFLRDHLGSVRAIVAENGEAIERNDYYPFGSHRTVAGSGATPNRFKYNGKELQITGELGFLDYGARMYDAELGRWFNTDPLSEKYYSQSSYNYCGNNPVVFVDPNGMDYWTTGDPGMIALFFNTLREANSNPVESFDYSDWAHYTDAEVTSLLTLNDKTKKQWSSYGTVIDGVGSRVGVSLDVITLLGMGAFVSSRQSVIDRIGRDDWYRRSSGAIQQDYTLEALLLPIGKGLGMLSSWVGKGVLVKGVTVLGHYPEYVKLATELGARRFGIPTNIWNKMTPTQQWTANLKFLDRMIQRGDRIRLATPLNKVKSGSFYEKELNYLLEKGYKVSNNGFWLVK